MTQTYSDTTSSYVSGNAASTLTAFFDNRSEAEAAIARLRDAGIAQANLRLVPGYEADRTDAPPPESRTGFWAALEDFFFPDDDREVYSEGLRRGGFLVTVSGVDDGSYETVRDILDDEGSINLDERADTWRTEGWNGSYSSSATTGSDRIDIATQAALRNQTGGNEETIPVVEENLRVGKRDVNAGSVKVRAYTVESPVNESLTLRDENVTIERRNVDRLLTDADRAFEERTISAEEHHEEAVVSKEARVVEEIGIKKTEAERTEEINETVRHTEVEVEDKRGLSQGQSQFGQSQSQRS
ncbi:hypothetical protein DEM27_23830 [Metarhizobium album]|uniref:DUF2382 domain-containing protein n=1 Tax=Metarhizobium album TaxID=2182425 RepID=A0A2U2DKW2_9HYPH|nr:YsnF/AvaK domain-containing protein [Rhizobium album]PWE53944.1 hypothetical protein DEM27_23830 [Rhizobium album]